MDLSRRAAIIGSLVAAPAMAVEDMVSIQPQSVVYPTDTDPEIRRFNNPQAAYAPLGSPRGELFVLLPGTGGKKTGMKRLMTNAALVGYHVIEVMYNDDIPADICARDADPNAFAEFRWALIEGGSSPHLDGAIPRAESIESRLAKFLQYLEVHDPDRGWGQYLQGSDPAWGKIAIGGMSQGGGHAALIATRFAVARVLCFGAPKDYSQRLKAPAAWYQRSVTPPGRYFAFNNTHDAQGCNYEEQVANLQALGVAQLGTAMVDGNAPPYGHAHALFTNWTGDRSDIRSTEAHTSVSRDNLLASDGTPLFRPVWRYMLEAPTT